MYSRVYVEITNICNKNCSFCHGHHRRPGRMDEAAFARVLDQLTGQTQSIYYHLMGEPLTHPELPLFLNMAADKDFRSVITTNGTLLDKKGKLLLDANVHKVSISLHSLEAGEMADYLEQVSAFADAAASTETLVSLRLWNRGSSEESRSEDMLAFLQQRLAGEWVPNTRGYRIRDRLYLEWGDRFAWPDTEAPLGPEQVMCYGMRDQFGILCDGSVVPCCLDSEGVITLGNVFEQDLAQILNTPRARAIADGFARRTAVEDLCRRCGYARLHTKQK